MEWSFTADDPDDADALHDKWHEKLESNPDYSPAAFWMAAKDNGYVKPRLDFLRSAMEMVVAELRQRLGDDDQSSDTYPSPCPFMGLEQTSPGSRHHVRN